MKSSTPIDFMDVIPAALPETKTSIEIVGSTVEQGWHTVKASNFRDKDPSKWNKQDLVKYFYNLHFTKFRTYISRQIPWGLAYQGLEEVRTSLSVQMNVENCGPLILKEYFEYFYDIHVTDILRSRSSPLSIKDASRSNYILSFLSRNPSILKSVKKLDTPKIVKKKDDIMVVKLEEMDAAYKIHAKCFILTYGVILPVNYLIYIKELTLEQAIAYVRKAVSKICEKDNTKMQTILSTTQRFGPYPKWFQFLDINEFVKGKIDISDDNQIYDFLRSSKI